MIKNWQEACAKLRRKISEEKANAGIIFALAAEPAFALVGGVMDYMNVMQERNAVQAALDTGTLASLNIENFQKEEVKKAIQKYLKANYKTPNNVKLDLEKLQVQVEKQADDANIQVKKVTASIPVKAKMPFMKLIGLGEYSFTVNSQAKIGSGGLEVVLVLDSSGSMGDPSPAGGTKMQELKRAASELIDKLAKVASRPTVKGVKVGIVPFTSHVMINSADINSVWKKDWLNHNSVTKWYWDGALGIRDPKRNLDVKDGRYRAHPVPAVYSSVFHYDSWTETWYYEYLGTQYMPSPMLKLTDVKQEKGTIKEYISRMKDDGWTYIPAGLAWGWRVLSSKEPFTEGVSYRQAREKGIKKIIVLMTDGFNTCQYHKKGYLRCSEEKKTAADERLKKLCKNIRNKGIGIITIAFDLDDEDTVAMLEECSNMGHYTPNTGELSQTFEDIANRLVALHLSK